MCEPDTMPMTLLLSSVMVPRGDLTGAGKPGFWCKFLGGRVGHPARPAQCVAITLGSYQKAAHRKR